MIVCKNKLFVGQMSYLRSKKKGKIFASSFKKPAFNSKFQRLQSNSLHNYNKYKIIRGCNL